MKKGRGYGFFNGFIKLQQVRKLRVVGRVVLRRDELGKHDLGFAAEVEALAALAAGGFQSSAVGCATDGATPTAAPITINMKVIYRHLVFCLSLLC